MELHVSDLVDPCLLIDATAVVSVMTDMHISEDCKGFPMQTKLLSTQTIQLRPFIYVHLQFIIGPPHPTPPHPTPFFLFDGHSTPAQTASICEKCVVWFGASDGSIASH